MEIIIITLGIILDRVSKMVATDALIGGREISIIDGLFSFKYLENTGAAFSILSEHTEILALFSLVAIMVMAFLLFKNRSEGKLFRISMSLVIAGAFGNMYDRFFKGYVIDFIKVHYKDQYTFPIFNVADICVCVGAFLLIIYLLKDEIKWKK